ncbi:MAG: hypothetical protein ACP5IJ_00785 [Candidatus Nanoarchaeia archaeon]
MVRHIFEIADEAKELKEAIHETWKTKKEIRPAEIAGWAEKILELEKDLALKLDEVVERLVRIEDEVRKKIRPEQIPKPKIKRKK